MAVDVPKSAASRNLDIAIIAVGIALICISVDWNIAAACFLGLATLAVVNMTKCFLDVQEMTMQLLNAIFKKLSRKDDNDNK